MDIQKARLLAVKKMPYMASLIYALRYYDSPMFTGVACVTARGVLVYNSKHELTSQMTNEEFATVIIHEALHVILKHSNRGLDFQNKLPFAIRNQFHQLMNICFDFEINDDLEDVGCKFPDIGLFFPQNYGYKKHLLGEEYFNQFVKAYEEWAEDHCETCGQEKDRQSGQDQQDNQEGQDNQDNQDGQDGQGGDGEQDNQDGQEQEQNTCPSCGKPKLDGCSGGKKGKKNIASAPNPRCGSGANNPHEIEKTLKEEGHLTDEQLERVRKEVAKAAEEHKKSIGSVPHSLTILIKELLESKPIDWRKQLAKYVRKEVELVRGLVNPTYSRLSRRQYNKDIVFPAYVAPKPKIGVLIDTSGSMSETELGMGLGQIQKMLKNLQGEIWVAVVDCVVHNVFKARTVKDIQAKLTGGGGTDLREAIRVLDDKGCDCVVGVSDCCAVFPKETPKASYVWLSNHKEQPPFGKFIQLEERRK